MSLPPFWVFRVRRANRTAAGGLAQPRRLDRVWKPVGEYYSTAGRKLQRGGRPVSAGGPVRTIAGSNLRRGHPPLSGAGIQAFSRRKPGRQKSRRGEPPCTPVNKTARWGSLHLLGWETQQSVHTVFFVDPPTGPDLETSFLENIFWLDFFQPCPSVYQPAPPSPPSWGAGPFPRGMQGRRPGNKKRGIPRRIVPNQSGESRGEKLSPLVFFPPFLTGEMEAAGRHPPRGAAPRGGV